MNFTELIPLAAIVIGIPCFLGFVALIANHTRKMKELAIRDRELELGGADGMMGPALDTLRDDLHDTRAQLADVQERLDFAERLLAGGQPKEQ